MRKKDSILISIKAFISTITCIKFFNKTLARMDFQKALISNKALASSSKQNQEEYLEKLEGDTMKRGRAYRKKLLSSFLWILSGLCISILIKIIITTVNNNIILDFSKIELNLVFWIISILLFSIATLGRLGWENQSWKENTVYEQLDNRLFRLFYLFGTILGSLALIL